MGKIPGLVPIPLAGAGGQRGNVNCSVADRWQTQIIDHGSERLLGFSLHIGSAVGMVAFLNGDELDRLIVNLQMRRGALRKGIITPPPVEGG